ncbi:hypothetical protein IV102_18830 [bacterium]|nr:hypothetical protein [bacterium]
MRAGLITCSRLPELHPDDLLLRSALAQLGVETVAVDWEGAVPPGVGALLLRTPWNYHRQLVQFLSWLESTSSLPMWNSRQVVRWNCHKSYLSKLHGEGLPVVPTLTFEPGQSLDAAALESWAAGRELVAKPAVSAGAFRTARYPGWNQHVMEHLHGLMETEAAMLQPYYAGIEQYGERSLIFLDGEFSHAVRRHLPLLEGPEVDYLMQLVAPTPAELQAARQILSSLPFEPLLYARVDLIPDPHGKPVLLELELIEPQLFLREYPPAAQVLARAWMNRMAMKDSQIGN